MTDSPQHPLLEVRDVTKGFPGVIALSRVNLTLGHSEVLALIGENGAGKSTLMKILAGVQEPDSGQLLIDGNPVRIDSVQSAFDHGVALIHQELNLSDNLDVGANIFLGREPKKNGLIDKAKIREDSRDLLARVGLNVSPDTIVERLPIGQQQLVEIARALSVNARVLIMDEPTSSLSAHEAETLFKVVNDLRSKGVSIIYISHRLSEVRELADRVTVFRDGENAGDLGRDEISHDRMVQLMVGRDVSQFYVRKPHSPGEVVLEVKDLVTPANPGHKLNFAIRAGEIVGVAGLVGAGRTETLQVLFGVEPAVAGTIEVSGKTIQIKSPIDAIQAGLALVPEDRKLQGLVLEMAVRTNVGLAGLKRNQKKLGFLNSPQEGACTTEMISKLRIKTPNEQQVVQYLSGGNQQKVVLGKWLSLNPKVLLLDEPTRGIDVGAKQEIYRLMEELAEQGMAILFVSSEMEEILGMSDHTLVMHEGRITGKLSREEISEEAVMQLATGNVREESVA
ncbi:MAG: sugar ABC transporter ATP-binding protein [Planctomycetaceae bacterium]|mgnify:FL=1|jgi:ribose transport system ATP-binding protein|nr:sugar ABC transporter ATP-binding protein [Planctomycetaceae bacterium]